jgi:hypothetical protein
MTIRENGKVRHVTKQRGLIVRNFDSALAKGDHQASRLLSDHLSKAGARQLGQSRGLPMHDDDELDAWLRDRLVVLDASELSSDDIEPSISDVFDNASDASER